MRITKTTRFDTVTSASSSNHMVMVMQMKQNSKETSKIYTEAGN